MVPVHSAIHEAAHAVMLWFIGWEDDLEWIEMRWMGEQVSAATTKPNEAHHNLRRLSELRRRLLFLWAGDVATECRFGRDLDGCWSDVIKMGKALHVHFSPTKVDPILDPPYSMSSPEAEVVFQDARSKAAEIVALPRVESAIDAVAGQLLRAPRDGEGWSKLFPADIFPDCEAICGQEFRDAYDWNSWLDD